MPGHFFAGRAKTELWVRGLSVGGAVLLLAIAARGQEELFGFDPAGNLLTETTESLALPQILGRLQTQVIVPGEPASFSVLIADTTGVTCQWLFNGVNMTGATSDALLLTNVGASNQGLYSVIVANGSGSVTSAPAYLYIDSRGCGMPDSWQLQYFGNLNQNPLGDYDGDGVSNLQEFLDGTNPTNAASALYRITLFNYGGSVMMLPDQPAYTNGQIVTLVAAGTNLNPFHAWTGDVTTRSNSIAVTMTNNLILSARFLPFTLVWTNTANGDWNVASSWSPNLVPGSNESVVIANQATVTENSNVDLVDFTLGVGTAGGGLTGAGAVTISGIGAWNNGTMSGGGRTAVKPGASLSIANGSGLGLSNRTLENAGTVVWAGGNFSLGGVITNDVGAQLLVFGPASFNFGGGASRFDNAGLLMASVGVTSLEVGLPFNNFGTVQLQDDTLVLYGGGTDGGVINVPAGATLNLAGGVFASSGDPMISGAGNFIISGALGALGGTVNVTGSNVFSNGSIDFTGSYILTDAPLTISGCAVSFDGASLVAPTVLTLSGGSLGGVSLVTVSSAMNWSGGSLAGTGRTFIKPSAALNINCTSPLFITSRTLEIGGGATWTGSSLISMNGGVITNDDGASFDALSPMNLAFGGGSPRFDNTGIFRTAPTAGTSSLTVAFNNYNDTQIQGGTLLLGGGGLNNGAIEVPSGTALNIGSALTSSANSSITGAGALLVSEGISSLPGTVNLGGTNIFSNGAVDFTGNYTCTNNTMVISGGAVSFDGTGVVSPSVINLSGLGSLGGAQIVTAAGAMSWTGGTMSGAGRTIIPAGATLIINNPSPIFITSRTLDNGGTTTWTGSGLLSMNGGVITNRSGALFNPQNASMIEFGGGSARFDNAGTFRKSVSTGTVTFSDVSFTNYGTVDIQSGVLYANGNGYASSSGALLNCGINGKTAGANYGRLQVSGPVTLKGTLSVNLTNNYIPTTNDSFTVLTAGTRNGTFTSFSYPSNEVTMQLSNTTNSVIVRVTAVAASSAPPPLLLPPALSGTNVLLTWTAVSNVTYRLEFNPDLTTSNWNALPGDILRISNTASKLDTLTTSNRFYRVQVLP